MSVGRRNLCLWVVLLLPLGLLHPLVLQAQDSDAVHFRWALEALVSEGSVTKQMPVREDTTLKTGDLLKLYLELRKPCFVYLIHHGAQGELHWLFPYDIQQFGTDYHTAKVYEIPQHDAWFRINEQAGRETFYLFASAQRLTDLEKLLSAYAAATPEAQPQVATHILRDLRTLIKERRAAVPPGRPVPIAGNLRKGIEALEISVPDFYSKTVTIEHR
jgi:hypothetical protein